MKLTVSQLRSIVCEAIEPFDTDLVNQLKNVDGQLNKLMFNDDFDAVSQEIATARSALNSLIQKLRMI